MGITLNFHEKMSGYHYMMDNPTFHRPMYFEVDAAASSCDGQYNFDLSGKIYVDGLSNFPVDCSGILGVDYFKYHRISYKLTFNPDTKAYKYTYFGAKENVRLTKPLHLIKTHTTCCGLIMDENGVIVSKSTIHFSLDDIAKFMRSFHLGIK